MFQHTAARRRLARWSVSNGRRSSFNTQPPEGGWAGVLSRQQRRDGFNTQPPEGGWDPSRDRHGQSQRFNTQPPEGGWPWPDCIIKPVDSV